MRSQFRFVSFSASMIALLLFVAATLVASAQTSSERSTAPSDAAWAKIYATDCGAAMKHPCPPSTNGYENEFTGDPRFAPLLTRSLPQRESWWVNGYGGVAPVSSIVQEFIGVPKDLLLDDDRYVTATGCVPHDCLTTGMLWINTETKPATVIFVGEDLVAGGQKGESGYHLYLYTSREITTYYAGKRHIEMFAPQFLKSLARWHDAAISQYDDQKIILVTIVWPNGATHDIFWSDLLKPSIPTTTNPGANQ
jgi:hypothetical protein